MLQIGEMLRDYFNLPQAVTIWYIKDFKPKFWLNVVPPSLPPPNKTRNFKIESDWDKLWLFVFKVEVVYFCTNNDNEKYKIWHFILNLLWFCLVMRKPFFLIVLKVIYYPTQNPGHNIFEFVNNLVQVRLTTNKKPFDI